VAVKSSERRAPGSAWPAFTLLRKGQAIARLMDEALDDDPTERKACYYNRLNTMFP
jgi:hypothetical protein